MPYESVTHLPESLKKHLPRHAQEIYESAFNAAERQYGDESTARKVGWSSVENKYRKGSYAGHS